MFNIPFKNCFFHPAEQHNTKQFVYGSAAAAISQNSCQKKEQKMRKSLPTTVMITTSSNKFNKFNGILSSSPSSSTFSSPFVTLFTVVYVCGVVLQSARAMPLQMLLMYTPNSNEVSDHLLFPLHQQRSSSAAEIKQKSHHALLANAFLPNFEALQPLMKKRHFSPAIPSYESSNNNNNSVGDDDDDDNDAIDEEVLMVNERPEQKDVEQNLLRAGRNIEESTAPKMYARHLGDLGGTMFRFG